MYSYNYQYPIYNQYRGTNLNNNINPNDERFVGGIIAPLLLGGVAGYAIGQNNNYGRPYAFYTQPYPYYYPYYNPYYYGRKF